MRLILTLALTVATTTAEAKDNNPDACRALFSDDAALTKQCLARASSAKGQPIQTLNDRDLKSFCSSFDSQTSAIRCFSEIGWLRFWKYDGLLPENKPGLASEFADDWKKTAVPSCGSEPSVPKALDCVVAHKAGMQAAYKVANKEFARSERDHDPIFQFCRKAFGDYWEGVERCVKDQRAAKARMGQ